MLMNEVDDKALAMGLLKQAAERNSIHQALYLMMKATPPGVAVNWVAVRTKLQDFIAKLSTPPGGVAFIAQDQVDHVEHEVVEPEDVPVASET